MYNNIQEVESKKRKHEIEEDLLHEEAPIATDELLKVDRALYELFMNTNEKKTLKGTRLVVLSGPTGSSKTFTIKHICKKKNYHIVDWSEFQNSEEYESVFDCLSSFLAYYSRRMDGQTLRNGFTKQILLFDDSSAFIHSSSNKFFNEMIEKYLDVNGVKFPIVFIITDIRINDTSNEYASRQDKFQDVNIRTFFTPNIVKSEKCKCFEFPPISKYSMTCTLQRYVNKKYKKDQQRKLALQLIPLIEKRSNGEINSAINLLKTFLLQIPLVIINELNAASLTHALLKNSPKKPKTFDKKYGYSQRNTVSSSSMHNKKDLSTDEIEELVGDTLDTLSRNNLIGKYAAVRSVLYNYRIELKGPKGCEITIKLNRLRGKEVAPDEMPDRHPIQTIPEVFLDNLDADSEFYLDLLQNNYIEYMGNISEIEFAAERLSMSDCLIGNGDVKNSEAMKSYAILYATRSLYFSHIQKVPLGHCFSGFKRSQYLDTFGIQHQNNLEYQEILDATYEEESKVKVKNSQAWQLEYVPYLKYIIKNKEEIGSKYNKMQKKYIEDLTYYPKY